MSEQPTQRFERPPYPPVEAEPTPAFEPLFPPESEPEVVAGASYAEQPPAEQPYVEQPPAEQPPAAAVPSEPTPPADPHARTRLIRTPAEGRGEAAGQSRPRREPAAARVAKAWFKDSDNVLMAITAVVAVLFLILVALLG